MQQNILPSAIIFEGNILPNLFAAGLTNDVPSRVQFVLSARDRQKIVDTNLWAADNNLVRNII